jgi:hypothetical protein
VGVGTRRDFVVQLRRSIGNTVVVTAAGSPALMDKPLQVGQGLGDRETALRGRQLTPEHVEGDLLGGAGFGREGRYVIVQPDPVVLDQLAGTRGRVVNWLAVTRIDDTRRQLNRTLE